MLSPFPFDGDKDTMLSPRPKFNTMKHLSTEERYTIHHMLQQDKSHAQIANKLKRSGSTISREIKRNSTLDGKSYEAWFACNRAKERKENKARYTVMSEHNQAVLEDGLKKKYSPEQISGRQKLLGAQKVPCTQTIYNYIKRDKAAGGALHKKLRHSGRRRKPRGQGKSRRNQIPNRRDISDRPKVVEERQRFGDFECDLVIGAEHSGALLTVVDRATGQLWISKLEDKTASRVTQELIKLLEPYKGRIHTITSDNGKEFAGHQEVSEALECEYYFARPYHSWERGSNENLNGLIRDYFPKKMTFYDITKTDVKTVQEELNNRPRKRYKFLTPIEFFNKNYNQVDTRCIYN